MTLIINGEPAEFQADRISVADLIARRPDAGPVLAANACAVEINRQLAPRRNWAETFLHDGDHVEIVTLVGGG